MAKANLIHDPSLTKARLKKILSHYYEPKDYEVGYSALLATYLYIKKNNWVGVAIKLKQQQKSTSIRISGYAPSFLVRFLFLGIIPILIVLPKWRKLESEVKEYLSSEQFAFDCDTL